MDTLQAIVLGIVQGLTEYLPISSTAHLRIVPAIFGWDDPGAAFTAVTQLGTMAAVLIYFRTELMAVLKAWFKGLRNPEVRKTLDSRLGWYIVLGTIPIAIFGYLFRDAIETGARNLYVISIALIALGFVLLAADRLASKSRTLDRIDAGDGATIGFAQALALIPGVSRSGATITAGLLRGFTRESAARYSFLLSVPAVVLSGLFELREATSGDGAGLFATAVATVLAFVVGYASIAFLLRFLVRHSLTVFVVYRVVLGSIVLGLVSTGAIR